MHLLILSNVSAGKHVAIFLGFCNLLCFVYKHCCWCELLKKRTGWNVAGGISKDRSGQMPWEWGGGWERGCIAEKQRGGEQCTSRNQDAEQESLESPEKLQLRPGLDAYWLNKEFFKQSDPQIRLLSGRFLLSRPSPAGSRQEGNSQPPHSPEMEIGACRGKRGCWRLFGLFREVIICS